MILSNEARISLTTEEKQKIPGIHCLAQGHLLEIEMSVCVCVCIHTHVHMPVFIFFIS